MFLVDERLREPNGQLQILGLGGEGVLRKLDDRLVFRRLDLMFPIALGTRILLPAGLFYLVINRGVPEVGAARIVSRNRS